MESFEAGHTPDDIRPDSKSDLPPQGSGNHGPIRGLVANDYFPKRFPSVSRRNDYFTAPDRVINLRHV